LTMDNMKEKKTTLNTTEPRIAILEKFIDLFIKDDYRVIFNKPATILFVNGEKFVSKAHNEEFDEEKGLLMCLAKANGISHLELKRLLKQAERPQQKKKS